MKIAKRILSHTYFTVFVMMFLMASAFAYLDPGTVTYVVSMVAALFIACGAALAIFRRKVKLFFQNLGKKKDTTEIKDVVEADVVNPMDETIDPMADDK